MTGAQALTNTLKTILIVDDVEDNRMLLERALRSSGYETVSVSSGREALSILSQTRADMVLLDWMMPELSGLDTLRGIREMYPNSKLPVIMCTAIGEEMSVVAALHAGANDYITKPISIPILRARMATLFGQAEVINALGSGKEEAERKLAERTRALLGSIASSAKADGR
jgi:DNA-binding response OmpR family regulator